MTRDIYQVHHDGLSGSIVAIIVHKDPERTELSKMNVK